MATALHITLAQTNPVIADFTGNLAKIRKIRDGAPAATDLIVFPEMAVCGYPPDDLALKPFFLDRAEQTILALAEESRDSGAWLAVSSPWREGGKIYNVMHLIGGGEIQASIKKHNLPNYGVFDERRVFSAGPLPGPVMFKGHRIGFVVCEDMWTPEVIGNLKDKGAELLIVVNASPYEIEKNDMRLEHARRRIREAGLPLIYVNQAGGQDELVFDGASFIMNEDGALVLQAEEFVEDIHHTVWEKTGGAHWLCTTDTIIPTHKGPDAVYQALMIGLRDYVSKNGFPGVLLGLSGGVDSALSAAIAVDALGADAVHGVMMPFRYTTRESIEDAAALAQNLGVALDTISIEEPVSALTAALGSRFTSATPSTAFENLQPRARGVILMALSNATGRLVLSTGNKSEVAVGYATLYGDMCGGFNALKDVYKTQVYELARWRNLHRPDHGFGPAGGLLIPERTLSRAPTAELKPGQTDQDTLPPYDALDDILGCLIEKDMSVADIATRGHSADLVKKVWRMVDAAEYKRRQAPPGVKITGRAFGRDRRYPITSRMADEI